jgi:hypothetical protein
LGTSTARCPKIAALLEDAEPEILAVYAWPATYWHKLRSADCLERMLSEIS